MISWAERAERVTPGGAQTRSKRATAYPQPFPRFLVSGNGCRVVDEHGHEYVDWVMGLASISLGYRHPYVDARVRRQLDLGVSFSLPTPLEVTVAERLCDVIPCAEMVRFVKTGSEANEAAMRIARLATGRDVILTIGYHGWYSVFDAAKPSHPGVPDSFALPMQELAFNDLAAVKDEFDAYGDEIAAVLVEPTRDEAPAPGYLEGLRVLCTEAGALLIFDEIVTGFRWALAGGQEFFGVLPDLATFGKGMANGYAAACVLGRRDVMEHGTYASGTYGGECVGLAACEATLDVYRDEPVIKHLWTIGESLIDCFNALGSEFQLVGYPVHPRLIGDPARCAKFISLLADEGVIWHPAGFNVSNAHTHLEVFETIAACEKALERLG